MFFRSVLYCFFSDKIIMLKILNCTFVSIVHAHNARVLHKCIYIKCIVEDCPYSHPHHFSSNDYFNWDSFSILMHNIFCIKFKLQWLLMIPTYYFYQMRTILFYSKFINFQQMIFLKMLIPILIHTIYFKNIVFGTN